MSSKDETSNREGREESSLIEWIGKTLLLLLCVRSIPKEPLMLKGKEGMRALMILMTTMRMSLKMKMIKLH